MRNPEEPKDLSEKIDLLLTMEKLKSTAEGNILPHILLSVVSAVTIVFLALSVGQDYTPSFIVLTAASATRRSDIQRKRRRRLSLILISFAVSVGASAFGNLVYYWVMSR